MGHVLKTNSLCGAGEHLYLKEEFSDVSIIVKNDGVHWRFPAHKLLLSSQSVVFQCMLSSDFSESKTNEIVIEDMTPTTVEQLLRYIYCGKVELENWREAIGLLQASHKYQLDCLVAKCSKFLEKVITISNVCHIYNIATIYSVPILKEKCLKLILDAGFLVLRSKAFEILSKEAVMEIVTKSYLNVDSELTVFDALLRWAPMQCCRTAKAVTEENILAEMQPFLQHVCFDDMSDTDKSALPPSILSCVRPKNSNRLRFSIIESLLPYTQELKLSVKYQATSIVTSRVTCIRFSIDHPVYLLGIGFTFMASVIPSHYNLYFINEVWHSHFTMINLASTNWKESVSVNNRKMYEGTVFFGQPFKIEERTVYVIACVGSSNEEMLCPKCENMEEAVCTSKGHINLALHCEEVRCVSSLVFIS